MNSEYKISSLRISDLEKREGWITWNCFPPTGDPIAPGQKVEILEYVGLDQEPVVKYQLNSSGYIVMETKNVVEIRWRISQSGEKAGEKIHWIAPEFDESNAVLLLRETRSVDHIIRIDRTRVSFPRRSAWGESDKERDLYFLDELVAEDLFTVEITGPVRLETNLFSCDAAVVTTQRQDQPEYRTEAYIDPVSGLVRMACSQRMISSGHRAEHPESDLNPKQSPWVRERIRLFRWNDEVFR